MNQNTKNQISRRHFFGLTTKGIVGAAILPTILTSCSNHKGANDRIAIGHIGVGSRGTDELMNYFLPLREALNSAVCDPFKNRRESVASRIDKFYLDNKFTTDKCSSYLDLDELLARKDIDAVHITTPDHWHVLAAIKAAKAGKHIMLAKPLGLSYEQNMVLKKVLAENNVKFHYGVQQRSFEHMKLAYDLIRQGAIGEVSRVDVWAPARFNVPSPQCNPAPVPEGFDFDRWTGPAPLREYCPERVTNVGSWFTNDYSIGFLGGWGAHPLDILVWILKDQVKGSYTCEGTGSFWPAGGLYNNVLDWDLMCKYTNGLQLHFVCNENKAQMETILSIRKMKEGNGTTFFGSKGWISVSRSSAESDLPEIEAQFNKFPKNEQGWIKSENNSMGKRFLSVVRGDEPELSPLDEAIISDTISHMGDIVIRTGRKVQWDPLSGRIVGDPEANKLYNREMRAPYSI